MHVLFRQLAQQMGLQNVRGILPDQIDLLLNTSILDILKQIIQTNIGLTNQNGLVTNSKIGQINSLRNLYSTSDDIVLSQSSANIFWTTLDDTKYFLIDNAEIYYGKKNQEGSVQMRTNVFNIRLVDKGVYANVINDSILGPKLNSPVGYYLNGKFNVITKLEKDLDSCVIRVNYIKKPCIVNISTNTSSDMPEQHHNDIVRRAVELYLASIGIGQRQERRENNNNNN